MDIADFHTAASHQEGAEMRVRKPDGSYSDCYIALIGIDSPQWREIVKNRSRSDMRKVINNDEKTDEDEKAEDLAKATVSWRGFTDNGEDIDFSLEKVEQLYKAAPYIADQVDMFIANRANFIKG